MTKDDLNQPNWNVKFVAKPWTTTLWKLFDLNPVVTSLSAQNAAHVWNVVWNAKHVLNVKCPSGLKRPIKTTTMATEQRTKKCVRYVPWSLMNWRPQSTIGNSSICAQFAWRERKTWLFYVDMVPVTNVWKRCNGAICVVALFQKRLICIRDYLFSSEVRWCSSCTQ